MRHLNPIPADIVEGLCDRIARALDGHPYGHGITLELQGFRRDRTPWDARRLANILDYWQEVPELVSELDALAKSWGGLDVGRIREAPKAYRK